MTIDAEDCLWVALFGGAGVRRYTPDGQLDRIVDLPAANVTSCAFGGPDHRQLYITTSPIDLSPEQRTAQPLAGGLFVCEPGPQGVPAHRFAMEAGRPRTGRAGEPAGG
jgi:sugar lactone lactonase YvrE